LQDKKKREKDEYYMKLAIDLAKKGVGAVNPNPLVGAIIVKDDRIIGRGYHKKYGDLHAERNAIKNYGERMKIEAENFPKIQGATMYVTLEPCCHYGKTPPCTEAIIENKIKRVVVASLDPNPLVAGKGIRILQEAGIQVEVGVLKKEADEQNMVFRNYIQNKKPLVTMKYAMTADGKLATRTGASKWITGLDARRNVHLDRLKNTGIMVGIGTVLADDPSLDCRLDMFDGFEEIKSEYEVEEIRNPIRIVVDSSLRTPFDSKLIKTAHRIKTIIATKSKDEEKINLYLDKGCQVLIQPNSNSYKGQGIDLNWLMDELGKVGIDSILLEGGSQLNYSALEAGIVDRVQIYISPKIFGGNDAKSPVGGIGVDLPDQAYTLEDTKFQKIGDDILLEGGVKKCLQE